VKVIVFLAMSCLSACSGFHSKRQVLPDPTELIVTGAPAESIIRVDGSQVGQATTAADHAQVLDVSAGSHTVEVRMGDKVVYREEVDVGAGERRVITVLSGRTR